MPPVMAALPPTVAPAGRALKSEVLVTVAETATPVKSALKLPRVALMLSGAMPVAQPGTEWAPELPGTVWSGPHVNEGGVLAWFTVRQAAALVATAPGT